MCLFTAVSIIIELSRDLSELTRVTLPVKVVFGVAVAVTFESDLLSSWAVRERNVVISNVVEEVNFFLL